MASGEVFNSLNPNGTIEAIMDRTPQGLLKQINAIGTPIEIIAITTSGNSQVCYFDRVKTKIKKLKVKEND